MIRQLTITAAFLATCSSVASANENKPDHIKSGIVQKGSNGGYVIVTETKKIPFILKQDDPDFRFGYVVPKGTLTGRTCHVNLNMPKPTEFNYSVKNIPQRYGKVAETAERTEIKGANFACKDGFSGGLRFADGDQLGLYQIKVYVDEELIKTLDFEVVPK